MSYLLRSSYTRLFLHLSGSSNPTKNVFRIRNCYISTQHTLLQHDNESNGKLFASLLMRLDSSAARRGIIYMNDLQQILATLRTRESIPPVFAVKLIRCCGTILGEEIAAKRIEVVQEIWKLFEERSVTISILHYNALLRVYIENEYLFNPEDIVKKLESEKLVPNAETYQLFMATYCQRGDMTNTNRFLKLMREKNIPLMYDAYRWLVMGHSKNNNMKKAEGVAQVVEKVEPCARPAVYSALAIEYIKKGNVKNAMIIFDSAIAQYKYSFTEYFDVLYELALNDYKEEFLRELHQYKHQSNYISKVPVYITKLILAGKPLYAYEIFKSMYVHTSSISHKIALGPFFLMNLVKYDVPFETIVKLSLDMNENDTNAFSLQYVMGVSLRLKKKDLALQLFKAAKSENLPIRLHYFWPLLINRARDKDEKGVFHLLEHMYKEYNLVANSETLRFYILPYIYSPEMDLMSFISKFKPYGVTISTLISSIVHHLLTQKEFAKAAEVSGRYGASYPLDRYEAITVSHFVETKDFVSFVKLMKAYCMGSIWNENQKPSGQTYEQASSQYIFGSMVQKAVEKLLEEENDIKYITTFFEYLKNNGITINSKTIEKIKNLLPSQWNDNLLLEELKYNKFMRMPPCSSKNSATGATTSSEESIERLYENMNEGEKSSELNKKYLFNLYARNYNLEKLLKLKEKMEEENEKLTVGMYALVVDTLVEHNKWQDALTMYREKILNKNFSLDSLKRNRLALLLIENDRPADAYEILSNSKGTKPDNARRAMLGAEVYAKILKHLAERDDVEGVKGFFKLYEKLGSSEVHEDLLKPLIDIHLKRNDLKSANDQFAQCVMRFKLTPRKNVLMRALALNENKEEMDKFISVASSLDDEGNILYELVLIYSEHDKIEKAKRVLQSRTLLLNKQDIKYLKTACERFSEENNVKMLHNLLLVTKGSKVLDREDLYIRTLAACVNVNDTKTGQTLWTEIQDEDIVPPTQFVNLLGKLFKKNGMPVVSDHADDSNSSSENCNCIRESPCDVLTSRLKSLINIGNLDEALKLKNSYKRRDTTQESYSVLILACLACNRYLEAKKLFEEYYSKYRQVIFEGGPPPTLDIKIVKYVLNEAVKNGDLKFILSFGRKASTDLKKEVSYNDNLIDVYIHCDKYQEYIIKLERKERAIETNQECEDFFSNVFSSDGILKIMLQKPGCVDRTKQFLYKCTEKYKSQSLTAAILWNYYMIKKKFGDADSIWKNYLQKSENPLDFKVLKYHISNSEDLELAMKLKEHLESNTNINSDALCDMYETLIYVYIQKHCIQEALNVLHHALTKVDINDLEGSILFTLKTACSGQNIPFDYQLPVTNMYDRVSEKSG